jgi:hypothetical protein
VAIILFLSGIALGFGRFRNHFDGMAGALFETDPATGAAVEIELVSLAGTEFDDGVFRAGPETAIAFKTVAAAQAPLCFITGFSG